MHFQAGSRKLFPIERDVERANGMIVPNYSRNVFVFRGPNRSVLMDRMDLTIELLANATGKRPEPLLNLALFYEREVWAAYLFPRGKDRADAGSGGELRGSPVSIR